MRAFLYETTHAGNAAGNFARGFSFLQFAARDRFSADAAAMR
jgi:hypothetical protein